MEKEKKVLTEAEIDKGIANIKAIWGIEGMGMTVEEEKIHRAFLAGDISEEENNSYFFEQKNKN